VTTTFFTNRKPSPLVGCAGIILSLLADVAYPSVIQSRPQATPGTYEDVLTQQQIGRLIVSSDASHLFFEWGAPYLNWLPNQDWIEPSVRSRLSTVLYWTDLASASPTAEYMFYPRYGSTYWLGDISPEGRYVAVFELSHDDQAVRAGTFEISSKQVKWLDGDVDEARLDAETQWLSSHEFVVPLKGKARPFGVADIKTGSLTLCNRCEHVAANAAKGGARSERASPNPAGEVGLKGAKRAAASRDGKVAVFVRNTSDVLGVYVVRAGSGVSTVFENVRRGSP